MANKVKCMVILEFGNNYNYVATYTYIYSLLPNFVCYTI